MSDEPNDMSEELAQLSDDDDLLRSEPAMPALAGRIEGVHGSISTLGMRIDALVSSTTAYRSSLTDRLAEYSDLVAKLTRAQATDLDEYRRANERQLTELRRSLANSESLLDRLGSRLDEIATSGDDSDGSARKLAAEVRSILDSQDRLGSFLTESLDEFSDNVLGRIASSHQEIIGSLESVRTALVTSQEATNGLTEKVAAPAIRAAIDELRADLQGLRRAVLEWPELTHTKEQVNALRNEVAEVHERVAATAGADAVTEVRAELTSIASRLDGLADVVGNGSALDGIRSDLGSVASAADLAGLGARIEALDPGASVAAALAGLDQRLDALAERVGTAATADDLATGIADLRADLAGVRDDASGPLFARLDTLSAEIDALRSDTTGSDQIGTRIDSLASGLEAMWADRSGTDELAARLDAIREAVDAVRAASPDDALAAIRDEVAGSSASTAQLIGEVAGMRAIAEAMRPPDEATLVAAVHDAVTEASAASSDQFNGAVAALRESLADVASGDVVAGLWDEVLSIRSSMDLVAERLAPPETPADPFAEDDAEIDAAADLDGELRSTLELVRARLDDGDGSASVIAAVGELRAAIDELRADVQAVPVPAAESDEVDDLGWDDDDDDEDDAAAGGESADDEVVAAPAVDAELIEALRDELLGALEASTGASADGLAAIRAAIEELRGDLDDLADVTEDVADAVDDDDDDVSTSSLDRSVSDQLDGLRDLLEELAAREPDTVRVERDSDGVAPDPGLASEVAALRAEVMQELGGLRQAVGFMGDSGAPDLEGVLDHLAALRSELAGVQASVEAAATSVGGGDTEITDDLVETLATELKALRRRIRLRASEEIFSEAQLDAIAAAIAARLGD